MSKEPREFWIQINQHNHAWLHGCLSTNVYTPEHIKITQDYELKWHKEMCTLVREVTGPDYKSIALELMGAIQGFQDHGVAKNGTHAAIMFAALSSARSKMK